MKVFFFSDSHCLHRELVIPYGVDMLICGGDVSNVQNRAANAHEVLDFLIWYESLPIKYKIFIAGNHDTSIEAGLVDPRKYSSIDYLEHESIERGGVNIFGSPYTPTFGVGWAFNKDKHKLQPYWEQIPENTDILVTHGPPKTILDLSYDRNGNLEYCGDKSLLNRVSVIEPDYHLFGHIHNYEICNNAGQMQITSLKTQFINGSCVTDRKFDLGLTSKGITFLI